MSIFGMALLSLVLLLDRIGLVPCFKHVLGSSYPSQTPLLSCVPPHKNCCGTKCMETAKGNKLFGDFHGLQRRGPTVFGDGAATVPLRKKFITFFCSSGTCMCCLVDIVTPVSIPYKVHAKPHRPNS